MNSGQNDLRITRIGQQFNLMQNFARRDTATQAAGGRDNAVAAGIITAFLNLEECASMSGQSPGAEDRHAALPFDIADVNPWIIEICRFDQAQQII
jgi:hypothetical protein